MALQGAGGTRLGALLPPRVAPRGALRLAMEKPPENRGKPVENVGKPWEYPRKLWKMDENGENTENAGYPQVWLLNLLENCVQLGAFPPRGSKN